MKNKKEVYILYNYNKFKNDYEYVKEYYNIKELKKDNKKTFNLGNINSIYYYINETLQDVPKKLLNDKYFIIKEILQ